MKNTPSHFQTQVYRLCSQIPEGKVSTYKLLSDALCNQGIKSSAVAVGQALKKNPNALRVPCHRVISSALTLGGYYGKRNCEKKKEMLEKEGIKFTVDFKIAGDDFLFSDFQPTTIHLALHE